MVGIYHIHIGYSDGLLDRICLPDCLKGEREGAPKLHRLWGALPDRGLIHTCRSLVKLCGQVLNELRLRCSWGNAAIQDNLRFSTKELTAPAAGKRTLNPSLTRWCNSPWMNAVISGVHDESWGPIDMARSRALCGQAVPVCTRMPFSAYSWSRGAAKCWIASGSAPRVIRCLEATKAVSEGACLSASKVFRSVAVISSTFDYTGGG